MGRLRGDRGWTVVELLVAVAMFMVLLVAVLSVLDSGTRNERAQQARDEAITQLRQGLTRVSKDVRQATAISSGSTRSKIDMQTLVGGDDQRIIYEVTGTDFVRRVCANFDLSMSCGTAGGTLVARLDSSEVFCYDYDPPNCLPTGSSPPPFPALTAVRIELSTEPEVFTRGHIRIATDVELRNI